MWKILWSMFGLIVCSSTSFAHPMGNFSINHYSKIKIDQKSIEIRYLIDMAEIPTFQEIRQFGITPPADDPAGERRATEGRMTDDSRTSAEVAQALAKLFQLDQQ